MIPDDPRPTLPERPADDACCGRACMHCVFDVYEESMTRYEALLREWEARQRGGVVEDRLSEPPSRPG